MALNVKKSFKIDPVKLMLLRVLRPPINSGYWLFGKTRSGKTVLMLKLSSSLHDKHRFKVWDLWGGKRNQGENLYWCLPSPYKTYWKYVKKRFRFNKIGSKQYKVNLAYPLTKNMPIQLPYLKNDKDEVIVNPKPFTIPIQSITLKQIKCVLNSVSDSDETLFYDIQTKLKKNDGMPELMRLFEKKGSNSSIYKNFFKPLIDMRMLSSAVDENVLDIVKEAKDREPIFVLVLHYLPEKFKLFILKWITDQIWEAMNMSKISGRNAVNIREATEFFRATERSTIENRFKHFKIELTEFIRQARGRFAFLLDAQSPTETSGLVSGSDDMTVLGRMPSKDDRENATDRLRRDGRIKQEQITDLGELESGEYYFIEDGKDAKKRYVLLPPCDFFRDSDQNFYSIWKKRNGNSWKDFSVLIKHVEDNFRLQYKEIRDIEKQKQMEIDEKTELRKSIEEEKQIKGRVEREKKFYEEKKKAQAEVREDLKKGKELKKENTKDVEGGGEMVSQKPHELQPNGSIPSPSIKKNVFEEMYD